MDSNGKYTIEQMVAAAHSNYGLVAKMATALGCERQTVYNYARKYKTVEAAIQQARAGIVDIAEVALLKKITSGDTASIVFVLKTLGKERGYVERREVEHDFSKMTDEQLRSYIKNGLADLSAGHSGGAEEGA